MEIVQNFTFVVGRHEQCMITKATNFLT